MQNAKFSVNKIVDFPRFSHNFSFLSSQREKEGGKKRKIPDLVVRVVNCLLIMVGRPEPDSLSDQGHYSLLINNLDKISLFSQNI